MVEFFRPPEIMGEFLVCCEPPRAPVEIIYRHRDAARANAMLVAVELAAAHGEMMRRRGWPNRLFSRPLFEVREDVCAENGPSVAPQAVEVWALHPRMSFADAVLYRTSTAKDAAYALQSVRRAATLGALYWTP